MKFLFDACIFKIGLLPSVKTGCKASLVVSGKECEYQLTILAYNKPIFRTVAKSYVPLH
jgi:hypothetical protein